MAWHLSEHDFALGWKEMRPTQSHRMYGIYSCANKSKSDKFADGFPLNAIEYEMFKFMDITKFSYLEHTKSLFGMVVDISGVKRW